MLEEQLVTGHGKAVYRLDGDNIRTGLNRYGIIWNQKYILISRIFRRDLGFSKADRAESVRRVGVRRYVVAIMACVLILTFIGIGLSVRRQWYNYNCVTCVAV